IARLGQMAQKEARVDEVEGPHVTWRSGDVGDTVIDVVNILRHGFGANDVDLGFVYVQTRDMPLAPHAPCKLARNVTAAAPHVETRHPWPNTNLVQEVGSSCLQDMTQDTKSLAAGTAALDCIGIGHDFPP